MATLAWSHGEKFIYTVVTMSRIALHHFQLLLIAHLEPPLEKAAAMPEARPDGIETFIDNLPAALAPLTTLDNWCVWKWAQKNNKWTKVPYQPSGAFARSNDRTTWAAHSTVVDAATAPGSLYHGIGWFFDENVNVAAFDIDNCIDPETHLLHPWAEALVERCGSYAEKTISGTGIRIIGYGIGQHFHIKRKVEGVLSCEIYRRLLGRYIVVTGAQIGSGVLVNIDQVIDEVAVELDQLNAGNGQTSNGGADAGDLIDELERTIKEGSEDHGDSRRSGSVYWVCAEMMRRGYAKDIIYTTITNPSNGISGHVLDQNNPKRAAERAIIHSLDQLIFETDPRSQKKHPTVRNMCMALAKMGMTFRYDDFSGRTIIDDRGTQRDIHDDDFAILKNRLELRFALRMPRETIIDVVKMASHQNAFHPIKDYFASLTWDGVSRLNSWLVTYCGAEDTKYHRTVGKLILVAAVRRVRQPGCKFDEMMVLEAPQGTEKSSALAVLSKKEEWFSDTLPLNIRGRETIELTQGKWIIEAAELSGMRRADAEHLKAFLSRQIDVGRMAYGRVVANVPRQFIIIGTTNSDDYLRDFTGNRRYWPVKVGRIDLGSLRENVDQLWAEACMAEAEKISIRLPMGLWTRAESEQHQRVTIDPYLDVLQSKIGEFENNRIAAIDVWTILSAEAAASHRTPEQNLRLGTTMKLLGWKKDKIAYHGTRVNGYIKGSAPRKLVRVERVDRDIEVAEVTNEEDPADPQNDQVAM
jgi:hypothetical protein